MVTKPYFRVLVFLFAVLIFSCETNSTPKLSKAQQKHIIQEIQKRRAEKDQFFKTSPGSPLLPEDKANFTGLNYYPIDLSLRFVGPLKLLKEQPIDSLWDTGGEKRAAQKYGYFEFTYKGEKYRLLIYRFLDAGLSGDESLFLGFTDATSGTETYGGGRYIDVERNNKGNLIVDFNLAYNPFCAYNPAYICALPPAENHLPFPVRAGEKIFKAHK